MTHENKGANYSTAKEPDGTWSWKLHVPKELAGASVPRGAAKTEEEAKRTAGDALAKWKAENGG